MNQSEKRLFLIERLLKEQPRYAKMQIPSDTDGQKTMLRSLMNIRMPGNIDDKFMSVQNEYLQQVNAEKGVVTLSDMEEIQPDIYIWKGDITRLKVGAIVNAANSGMTGCYQPCHNCIDNCIHTYAGIQLRLTCAKIMEEQGDENRVDSIAFCCISTGVFMFPNKRAAEIAVKTMKDYKEKTGSSIKVIFNVFKDTDEYIYRELLR